jgi:hypothetical protein
VSLIFYPTGAFSGAVAGTQQGRSHLCRLRPMLGLCWKFSCMPILELSTEPKLVSRRRLSLVPKWKVGPRTIWPPAGGLAINGLTSDARRSSSCLAWALQGKEVNVLLNPDPGFARIEASSPEAAVWDPRFFSDELKLARRYSA